MIRSCGALLGFLLVGCATGTDVTGGGTAGSVVAQAVVRPASIAGAVPFDVEITATNVGSAPIEMTMTSGCAFAFTVQAPDGRIVAAPKYSCPSVMYSLTLAAGEVLRETYRFETGAASFPSLPLGTLRIVPAMNVSSLPGLVIRAAVVEVR
jgi:hypothetical protein